MRALFAASVAVPAWTCHIRAGYRVWCMTLRPNHAGKEGIHMSDQTAIAASPPGVLPTMPPRRVFSFFNPIAKILMAAGVPMGPNGLITIRGRKSGLPRTTPVAIIEVSERRWVWAPWGDVQWVRNLRAAGRATITKRRQQIDVRATELDPQQRAAFFRDILSPLARGIPGGTWFIRTFDGVDLNRPLEVAEGRRVFELHPVR
jgi:deazaflavin-dependent oxidoreductase (nitroreductase family)